MLKLVFCLQRSGSKTLYRQASNLVWAETRAASRMSLGAGGVGEGSPPIKSVLFDMDGLLLDTENLYTEGTQRILSEFGQVYDWEFKCRLMGKRTDEVAQMIVDHYGLPMTPDEWKKRSSAIYQELFPHVKSLKGVTKLVHHLSKSKIPIAVASSSSTSSFRLKTERHSGLFSFFDVVVLGDDERVKNAKPAPDIFLTAADSLGVPHQHCLVVEDAPLGVSAGRAAGMSVLMVPHPKMDRRESQEANLVVSDLNQLIPAEVGLPAYGYQRATHLIFDMDGLLLNTQETYSRVAGELLASHGKTPDLGLRMKVMGRRAEEAAEMIVQHYGLPYSGEEYLKIFQNKADELFPSCDLLPGVERLIRHLHKNKVPIAVATSSSREVFNLKTAAKHSELFSLFSHIVTGCDPEISQSKPSPEIFTLCASRFPDPPDPANCLVFEDAPNGVTAGLAAGMQVVMVPDHKVTKEFLLPATQLLASMEHFQPEDFGLPPFSV